MSSSYRRNNDTDRNNLFSPASNKPSLKSVPKHKRNHEANRDALFGGMDKQKTSTTKKKTPKPAADGPALPSRGYDRKAKPKLKSFLSGAAKMAKLKEAEENRDKGTKAMERGVFKRPDPIAAGSFYLRAADAYGLCGESRLERLHRVASADCQMGSGAYPSAAREYMKAAKLSKDSDEALDRKRKEGNKLLLDAAKAWTETGEFGKAASAAMEAALAWLWEDETTFMNRKALTAIEEAVERHVPDVLNEYKRFRQTGVSSYIDPANPREEPTPDTMMMAREAIVKTPYAHEPLQDATHLLVRYGEYESALYCCGAASAILEHDGVATLTLGRNFCEETIITLALGDPILAEEHFVNRHLQNTSYLTSRECKLAEDLYKAVKLRNEDDLQAARSPNHGNQAALANLNSHVRSLVQTLRLTGAAKKTHVTKIDTSSILADSGDNVPNEDKKSKKKSKSKKKKGDNKKNDLLANRKGEKEEDPETDETKLEEVVQDLKDLGGLTNEEEEDSDFDDDEIDLR